LFHISYTAINKGRYKIKIYNSIPVNKPIQPIKPAHKSREILNFNNIMYKYSKDVLNIEEAKHYNSISHKKIKKIDISSNISNTNNHNNENNQNDMADIYAVMLNNIAKLKENCKIFIKKNNIINFNSPEVLLHAAFLNSQLTLSPIISKKNENDE